MKVDVRGRVRNSKLPASRPLLPVFEAVVNSIHAIEELGRADGEIRVRLLREALLMEDQLVDAPIESFVVTDNGIGFNDHNFQAFQTADTLHKREKGGKGVGRFLWLKAFDEALVRSVFAENGAHYERCFAFRLTDQGIEDQVIELVPMQPAGTELTLRGMREVYRANCPARIEVIARKIVQHCMSYLLGADCPRIFVLDDNDRIDVNRVFEEEFSRRAARAEFTVKGAAFSMINLRVHGSDDDRHRLHYCANSREVIEENLSSSIPDLQGRLHDEQGAFVISSYVFGELLDQTVTSERTDFVLSDRDLALFPEEITKEDLRARSTEEVRRFAAPFLAELEKNKMEHIEEFVKGHPQFRPLLKHGREFLSRIPPHLSDKALEVELYRAKMLAVEDMKRIHERFVSGAADIVDSVEYRALYSRLAETINDFAKSELAQYVLHRKLVLDLLEERLSRRDDGRYSLEEEIHQLVFPLRTTSEDVDSEQQNLWLIDEKLVYHSYLSSERRLDQAAIGEFDSGARPDLLIFDHPHALVEGRPPFGAVVIVEFKRPQRASFARDENPVSQVLGYVRSIREGKANDRAGRPITVPSDIPFYAFILCDLTPRLRVQAEDASLIRTPDNWGYFGFNRPTSCYIEVISYDKMVADARKRNQILFDKLGLPGA